MRHSYFFLPSTTQVSHEELAGEAEAYYEPLQQLLQDYAEDGCSPGGKDGAIRKVVHACRTPYRVALLGTGRLLLLCPTRPEQHGTILPVEEAVVDVAAGAYHFVCCTASGAVYSFGCDNRLGQLGTGGVWSGARGADGMWEDLSAPARVGRFGDTAVEEDSGRVIPPQYRQTILIEAVACGEEHTLLLPSTRNKVYACGAGECGQLGDGAVLLQPSFRSIRLLFGQNIKMITAAGRHSFALLSSGKLFAFGDNTCGQLGLGHTRQARQPEPVAVVIPLSGDGETPNRPSSSTSTTTGNAKRRHLMDAKAFSTLRAGYSTVESALYPLRMERLDGELSPPNVGVSAVWTGLTHTVVRTVDGEWLSCGLALGTAAQPETEGEDDRYDGFGALGRPLVQREDAYVLRPMNWGASLEQHLQQTPSEDCQVYFYPGLSVVFGPIPEVVEEREGAQDEDGVTTTAHGEVMNFESPIDRLSGALPPQRKLLAIQGFPSQENRLRIGGEATGATLPLLTGRPASGEGDVANHLRTEETSSYTEAAVGEGTNIYDGGDSLYRKRDEDDSLLYDASSVSQVIPLERGLLIM
ncbi:Regulator of chromosome condensation (RCC1) repeat, putative [Angomonas deanei]|uniref:Regulator of chromosome condensation (RCC1) repeat, putative n=1 Tax=Angomonas deanei TaxID=59799 RepID=A0A7G2C5G7_9TRYP|nr:Regulator of chromosome condensation (RCC1) repeat, putative [Angomonas deanei]